MRVCSTAALYPVAPNAVWTELTTLAGGAAPIVTAARARVDADEPVEALLLLDVAREAGPESEDALALRVRALEILLDRAGGENFSEMRWLQTQIEALRSQLGSD